MFRSPPPHASNQTVQDAVCLRTIFSQLLRAISHPCVCRHDCMCASTITLGVRHSRVVTFAAIRLQGLGFKPRPEQKFETRFLLRSHPSGGEGVSPMQGEAIRRRYIKPEYLSYPITRVRLWV